MAKGQKHGNREAKKPKQDKPKAAPSVSPFAVTTGKPDTSAKSSGGKR